MKQSHRFTRPSASNKSSLPVIESAAKTKRRRHVIGFRSDFFVLIFTRISENNKFFDKYWPLVPVSLFYGVNWRLVSILWVRNDLLKRFAVYRISPRCIDQLFVVYLSMQHSDLVTIVPRLAEMMKISLILLEIKIFKLICYRNYDFQRKFKQNKFQRSFQILILLKFSLGKSIMCTFLPWMSFRARQRSTNGQRQHDSPVFSHHLASIAIY